MVARLETKWKVNKFVLGSVAEGLTLSPEGSSQFEVFKYLTNQIQKIYSVYESVSDFPLGLLLVLVYFHSIMLFETKCHCERQFDFSGSNFGMLPPQFRDMWMRPDFMEIYKHNMC